MRANGGLVDERALANYEPVWREPLNGSYRGYEIVTMGPPSSGGVHILQILNVLEHFDVRGNGAGSAASVHLLAEAMRLAYADRSKHLGDPDFYPVPIDWLTSKGLRPHAGGDDRLGAGAFVGRRVAQRGAGARKPRHDALLDYRP